MNAVKNLMESISKKESRVVVGLDPTKYVMPEKYLYDLHKNPDDILYYYCKDIIDAIYDIVPSVKPNIAFFERYNSFQTFFKVCDYAKERGLVVVADAKRADIGATSLGYADSFLSENSPCDFLTINPYFGEDSVKPFVEYCDKNDKGLFVLVKTSNKSSKDFQDLVIEDGKRLYEKVAEKVSSWGIFDSDTGYSNVGAVVGATHPKEAESLRKLMPKTFFLVPGFGAQGATVEDVLVNFDDLGNGAIINASRSVLGAYKQEKYSGMDFQEAAREEARNMTNTINDAIKGRFS